MYWGKTSLRYLHNTESRIKYRVWRLIDIRSRRSVTPASAHAEFADITNKLPDADDGDYVLDDYTEQHREGEHGGEIGSAMVVDAESGEESTADG